MIKTLFKRAAAKGELGDALLGATLRSAQRAFERQPWACAAGVLCGWTALFAALWVAMLCAVAGAIGGFFAIGFLSFGIGQASQGLVLAGAAAGFGAGFVHGFLWIYGGSLAAAPGHVLISLLVGLALAFVITGFCVVFEGIVLDFRSYRRPSRRAQEAALQPLLREVGEKMGLSVVPHLRIADSPAPGVWTFLRYIVVSKGLIDQMDEEELAAVMAHELHHWIRGDPIAQRFVWACTFPLVVLVNFYTFVFTRAQSVQRFATYAWVIVWPAFTLLRFVVEPLMVARGRTQEYEADAGAIAAGYGAALASALAKAADFEMARTGWEEALLRSHPPIEFRLEAIEEAAAPPAQRRTTAASGAGKATNGRTRQSARSTGSAAGRS
jgi:Zn-dependent protease with chaperone function